MSEREKIEVLENKLNHALNLTAALQLVAWEMCQRAAEPGSQDQRIRDAVVGLSDALDRALV